MSAHAAIYMSREKDRKRERVVKSGNDTKIKAYKAAETKEALAMLKFGGAVVTKNPVSGLIAAKELWDANDQQSEILKSLDE